MPATLLYTAVPVPTSPDELRLTVMVTPRLFAPSSPAQLRAFPDLLDWPARVEAMPISVQIAGRIVPATVAPPRRAIEARDSALWRAIFPPECEVDSWAAGEPGLSVVSFPAAGVAQRVADLYTEVASAGVDKPRVLDVPGVGERQGDHDYGYGYDYVPNAVDRFLLDVEEALEALAGGWTAGLSPDVLALSEAIGFYRRTTDADPPASPPTPPRFEFHRRVALMGDHPVLLRRLGLAFDVVVRDTNLATLPPTGTVRVRPRWRSGSADDLCPFTRYDASDGRFKARVRDPQVYGDGFLRLNDRSVYELDVDSAVSALRTTMAAIRGQISDPQQAPIHEQALPALASPGITIVHPGRRDWLSSRLRAQEAMLQADPNAVELDADDLVRGWRIDVNDGSGWRSLCRRFGTVADAAATPLVTIPATDDDEGYVKLASTASTHTRPNDVYLHERLAVWTGWSLAARMPGRAIQYQPGNGEVLVDGASAMGASPVRIEYRPTPRSLPRLRFGRRYQIRVRMVDVAGGGVPLSDPRAEHATAITYRRWEPIPSPMLVPREVMLEAESPEHVVVRTDPAGARPYERLASRRHVLAPKTSFELWEKHGRFDRILAEIPPESAYAVACRESGSLLDADNGHVIYSHGGTDVTRPIPQGESLQQGEYVAFASERIRLPWLADPAAGGLAIWDADAPSPTTTRWFQPRSDAPASTPWLEPDSLLIVVHAAPVGTPPTIRAGSRDDRELHIDLPPGRRMRLRYASVPSADAETRETLAIRALVPDAVRALVDDARHWMTTPSRELVVAHAAQRPAAPPLFATEVLATRAPGASRASINARVAADGPSTSHVDVRATWLEIDDSPGTDAPSVTAQGGEAFRVAFAYEDSERDTFTTSTIVERRPLYTMFRTLLALSTRTVLQETFHELPDAKRRIVTYHPVATTRWQEYFPPEVLSDPANLRLEGERSRPTSIPAAIAPDAPAVVQVLPTFAREVAGSSRSRRGNSLRIWLDRPWFSSGVGERLAILLPQSKWGGDAVWSHGVGQALASFHFAIDGSDRVVPLGSDEVPRVEAVADLDGRGQAGVVVVPQFDTESRRWYADVSFVEQAYFPFVSLAVARWQPDAAAGTHLSPVVQADIVQLAPDRTASIVSNFLSIAVTVRGISAGNRAEAQWAGNPGGAHRVRAHLQQSSGSGELDWTTLRTATLTAREVGAEVEWTGRLARPAIGRQPLRVVIEESEVYAGADRGGTPRPGERITYVEILNVR